MAYVGIPQVDDEAHKITAKLESMLSEIQTSKKELTRQRDKLDSIETRRDLTQMEDEQREQLEENIDRLEVAENSVDRAIVCLEEISE